MLDAVLKATGEGSVTPDLQVIECAPEETIPDSVLADDGTGPEEPCPEPTLTAVMPGDPTEGARILCCICGSRPFADAFGPPGARVDFDLMRLDDKGRPAASPEGRWFCSKHFKRLGDDRYQLIRGEQ